MDFPLDYEVRYYPTFSQRLCRKAVTFGSESECFKFSALRIKKQNIKYDTVIPEVAGVGGRQSVDVETEVGYSQVEHKEVTGIPHLLDGEEGHDADGVEEESYHSCRTRGSRIITFLECRTVCFASY